MKPSQTSLEKIRQELVNNGLRNKYLLSEICDHIASDMEQMMDQGTGEDEALQLAFSNAGYSELDETRRNFQGILNTRFYRMKILLWISFSLFAGSWLISSPLGLYTALLSFLSLGITLILLSIDFFRSRKYHGANLAFALATLLSSLFVIAGMVLLFAMVRFRVNTRGHGPDLMIFSYLILSLVIFFYFIRQRSLSVSESGSRKNTWFIVFSALQLCYALLAFLSLPLYAMAADYIWILIWAILLTDLASLFILLSRRIRSILFMTLLLLSFMITFIHSPLRRLLPAGKPPAVTQTIKP
jgi:hypothetical protein